jgi:acetaldehyde dehydrogenase
VPDHLQHSNAPGALLPRTQVAIIGSGNIGTDLLYKALRSRLIEPIAMIGIDESSAGLKRARDCGLWTTASGLDTFLAAEISTDVTIVFDATSAAAHRAHAPALQSAGKVALDLTPAAIGAYVVPAINVPTTATISPNLNFVSCGGQATVPIVYAIGAGQGHSVSYAEVVSTTASKSVGPGTRANLDDYLRTTSNALCTIGGASRSKTIALISPASPPIMMRNTVYCLVEPGHDAEIAASVESMIDRLQRYVPGYRLVLPPQFEVLSPGHSTKVMVVTEVEGAGDYLESYAGNLDIITSVAVDVAERCAAALAAGVPIAAESTVSL